jgi:O-methyltransferase
MNNQRSAPDLYLDLLKQCLTRIEFGERHRGLAPSSQMGRRATSIIAKALRRRGFELVHPVPYDRAKRELGLEFPPPFDAETMIGLRRLDNLQACIQTIVAENVPGDVIETGVWRGGATIFMKAALEAYGDTARRVWAADSFAGLPKPDGSYAADEGDDHWTYDVLAVGLEDVKRNFRRYGLLDERVEFLVGWFSDTLPSAPIDALSLMRLDGDMYVSTIDALRPLYPKLSPGGFVIVDDYRVVPGCQQAVDDYRAEMGIEDPIIDIDGSGVYWRRS